MRVLIVGAGATGGYLGDRLIAGGRDVTFLARERTRARLVSHGLRLRDTSGDTRITQVRSVISDELDSAFDVVVVGVRSDAIDAAIADMGSAVGSNTTLIPLGNGVAHVEALRGAYGDSRVVGATAEMATSLLADGVIDVSQDGVRMTIGALDGSAELDSVAAELRVDDVDVAVVDDVVAAMWSKFLFIVSTATLTCLSRGTVADIARNDNGVRLADQVLGEVAAVVTAATGEVPDSAALRARLNDTTWEFGPSMYRDLMAGRRVEVGVLSEMAAHARSHAVVTPLLDAATIAIRLHNHRSD